MQVAPEGGQGDIDDGGVQDGRYPAQHEDPDQPAQGGVEAVVRRGAGGYDILRD